MPPAAAASPSCVFVYGTLMAEEVVQALLGRVPAQCPAAIRDHRRYAIVGRQYPAIVPAMGHRVRGKVMFDLSRAELEVLDLFEDEEYTRRIVRAVPCEEHVEWLGHRKSEASFAASRGEDASSRLPCDVGVYVWCNERDPNLQGEWDYKVWRETHLLAYVDMCKCFPDDGDGMDLRLQLEQKQQNNQGPATLSQGTQQ